MAKEQDDLVGWFEDNGGVASVVEVAGLLDVDENYVRRFARENDVRRIGSTFVFSLQVAEDLADELAEPDEDDEEDDEDDAA